MDKSIICECGNQVFWWFGDFVRCTRCYTEYKQTEDVPGEKETWLRRFNNDSHEYDKNWSSGDTGLKRKEEIETMEDQNKESASKTTTSGVPLERLVVPWYSVDEILPTECKKVLVFYKNSLGNGCIVLAERYEKLSVECNCEYGCNCEYDEKRDGYYLPPGWYEIAENHDEFQLMLIDDKITHWTPLPLPPKEEA